MNLHVEERDVDVEKACSVSTPIAGAPRKQYDGSGAHDEGQGVPECARITTWDIAPMCRPGTRRNACPERSRNALPGATDRHVCGRRTRRAVLTVESRPDWLLVDDAGR